MEFRLNAAATPHPTLSTSNPLQVLLPWFFFAGKTMFCTYTSGKPVGNTEEDELGDVSG
jgi:hypothetical protein